MREQLENALDNNMDVGNRGEFSNTTRRRYVKNQLEWGIADLDSRERSIRADLDVNIRTGRRVLSFGLMDADSDNDSDGDGHLAFDRDRDRHRDRDGNGSVNLSASDQPPSPITSRSPSLMERAYSTGSSESKTREEQDRLNYSNGFNGKETSHRVRYALYGFMTWLYLYLYLSISMTTCLCVMVIISRAGSYSIEWCIGEPMPVFFYHILHTASIILIYYYPHLLQPNNNNIITLIT